MILPLAKRHSIFSMASSPILSNKLEKERPLPVTYIILKELTI